MTSCSNRNSTLHFQSNESSVPDEVRDMWKPPCVEAGIPPLLTTPGVQLPNDLVNLNSSKIFKLQLYLDDFSFGLQKNRAIQSKRLLSTYSEKPKRVKGKS